MTYRIYLLFSTLIIAGGCVSTATLYPANDEAKTAGLVTANYQNNLSGGGKITLTLKDGEVLSGEYTTTDTNNYSFGGIYTSAYGSAGSGTRTESGVALFGASPGIATLQGDRGTSMACEYLVSIGSGKGAGACRSSTGAVFRVPF